MNVTHYHYNNCDFPNLSLVYSYKLHLTIYQTLVLSTHALRNVYRKIILRHLKWTSSTLAFL